MSEEAIQKSVTNHLVRVSKEGHENEARCLEDVCYWLLESGEWINVAELRKKIEKLKEEHWNNVPAKGQDSWDCSEWCEYSKYNEDDKILALLPKPQEAKRE